MPDYQGKPPSLGYPSRSTGRPQALGQSSTSTMANERLAAKQARGEHSPVGPRPGPATPAREMSQYDEHRAILEHQLEKERRTSWLQRSKEAQGRAQRQMSPRKPSRDRSRS